MKHQHKSLKTLLAVLLTTLGFGLTACSDDDEPKVEDNFSTEYTFEVEFSADILGTADVKAYILSPEGTVTEETITKSQNAWTFKGSSIPDKAGVRFDFDAKSGDFSGNYELGYTVKATVTCLNNGGIVSVKSKRSDETFTVSAVNLSEFYGCTLLLGGQVNAEGEVSVTDGSDLDFGLNAVGQRYILPIFR